MEYEETVYPHPDGIDASKSVTKVLNELKVKKDSQKSTIEQILVIADTTKSRTIYLKEFNILYPKSVPLFYRDDSNHNSELDLEELNNLFYTDELATKMLERLQKEEYENNIIKIVDLMKDLKFEEEKKKIKKQIKQDLFKSIRLKDLNFEAADYLITRFDLKKSADLSIEELKNHIDSYTVSKEFLNILKVKVDKKKETYSVTRKMHIEVHVHVSEKELKEIENVLAQTIANSLGCNLEPIKVTLDPETGETIFVVKTNDPTLAENIQKVLKTEDFAENVNRICEVLLMNEANHYGWGLYVLFPLVLGGCLAYAKKNNISRKMCMIMMNNMFMLLWK